MLTSTRLKIVAALGSVLPIVAALPVPYLVFKSVYFLTTDQQNTPFHEMINDKNGAFWALGPAISFLALLAVAPFNVYNFYRSIKSIKNTEFSLRNIHCKSTVLFLVRILALSFGFVNGYNLALAYNDVATEHSSIGSQILRGILVGIATLLAGIDSRVAISGFKEEVPRDFRFLKYGFYRLKNRVQLSTGHTRLLENARSEMLYDLRKQCDKYRMIALFELDEFVIERSRNLIMNNDWIEDSASSEFQAYLSLMDRAFPVRRYFASEVIGSLIALTFALINSVNTWSYTQNAVTGFMGYLGSKKENTGIQAAAIFFSIISTSVGLSMSFFMIRDLFFRDIMKPMTCHKLLPRTLKNFALLIPALSFALLNVALTFMNKDLSTTTKTIVSIFSVLSAAVVLRYAIEGGLQEWRGHCNLRRELAKIPEKIMTHAKILPDSELTAYHTAGCSSNSTAVAMDIQTINNP